MVEQTDYRLTAEDETKVKERIAETISEWRYTHSTAWTPDLMAESVLVRLARQAIGCSAYDLTDAENAWVTAQVRAAIEGYKPRGY